MAGPRRVSALLVALVAAAALAPGAFGAVFTVDLGSEWIKIAVVSPRLKPDPIAIAINEMSKRKSPALVAISAGERLISEEAAGIAARYPDRVYSRSRDLVGVPLGEAQKMLASTYAGFTVTGRPEGAEVPQGAAVPQAQDKVWIKTHDGKVSHLAEEVVGMVLEYAQRLSEAHARFEVVDAVVSVPPYFSQAQRQALLDAAALVGVNAMALVHEHAAVALQYGMFRSREELEVERDVLLYDMGGSSTYAAILRYSQYTTKERGKNVTNPQFQVKAVRWDHELGGQTLELRLLEHFAAEFNSKMGKSFDVRQLPKSMAKLKKAVRRTKEVLSANTDAPISVESLYEETDFRSSITRDKFEELCADVWPRAVRPLQQVLEDTGLGVEDLYAVELVGGGTRVPRIQAVLQEFLGPNKTLDRHLDADESVALGASWLAANLSDGFKLNRKIGMVDGMPYGVLYRVQALPGAPQASVEAAEEALFPRLKKFPLKIIRSLKQQPSEDLELALEYDQAYGLPPMWPAGTPILTYHILGIKNATDKYSSYNLTNPLKTSVHFEISRSGLVGVEKAELVVDFSEWTEVRVPIISNKTATPGNATANGTQPEGGEADKAEGGGEKVNATEAGGGAAVNATEAAAEEAQPQYELKQKLRKRTIRVPLEVVDVTVGFQRKLSVGESQAAQKRIDQLRQKEEEKKRTAEAKNALESYIYSTKDKLDSEDEQLLAVSTEDQRQAVRSQLLDAEEWLYLDGENAGPAEFQGKLAEIQKDAEAIFFRQRELDERPAAVKRAKAYVADTKELLDLWKDEKTWLNHTVHIQPIHEDLADFEKWLGEKEAEQSKTKPHEEPAFPSRAVLNRLSTIKERVSRVDKIPKPKPKKVPPPKADSSANDTKANDTKAEDMSGEKPLHDEL